MLLIPINDRWDLSTVTGRSRIPTVRHQIIQDIWTPDLKETLAHLVGHLGGDCVNFSMFKMWVNK